MAKVTVEIALDTTNALRQAGDLESSINGKIKKFRVDLDTAEALQKIDDLRRQAETKLSGLQNSLKNAINAGISTEEAQKEFDKLQKKIRDTETEIKKLGQASKNLANLGKPVDINIEKAQREFDKLQNKLKETEIKLDGVRKASEGIFNSLNSNNFTTSKAQGELENLKKKIKDTGETLILLREQLKSAIESGSNSEKAQSQFDKLQNKIEKTTDKLKLLEKAASTLSDNLSINQVSTDKAETEFDALKNKIEETSDRIKKLYSELKTAEGSGLNTDRSEKELQQLQLEIKKLEQDARGLSKTLGSVSSSGLNTDKSEKELNQLQSEIRETEKEIKKVSNTPLEPKVNSSAIDFLKSEVLQLAAAFLSVQKAIELVQAGIEAVAKRQDLNRLLAGGEARQLVLSGGADTFIEALGKVDAKVRETRQFIFDLAKASPFSREQVQEGFRLGQAYGFTADEAKKLLTVVVDYASATGAPSESIERILRALGQMKERGKVMAEELNQLRDAGVNIAPVFDAMGVSMETVRTGTVSAEAFLRQFSITLGGSVAGAAKLAMYDIRGLTETLGDLGQDALYELFNPQFENGLQNELKDTSEAIETSLIPALAELGEALSVFAKITDNLNLISGSVEGLSNTILAISTLIQTATTIYQQFFTGIVQGFGVSEEKAKLFSESVAKGLSAGFGLKWLGDIGDFYNALNDYLVKTDGITKFYSETIRENIELMTRADLTPLEKTFFQLRNIVENTADYFKSLAPFFSDFFKAVTGDISWDDFFSGYKEGIEGVIDTTDGWKTSLSDIGDKEYLSGVIDEFSELTTEQLKARIALEKYKDAIGALEKAQSAFSADEISAQSLLEAELAVRGAENAMLDLGYAAEEVDGKIVLLADNSKKKAEEMEEAFKKAQEELKKLGEDITVKVSAAFDQAGFDDAFTEWGDAIREQAESGGFVTVDLSVDAKVKADKVIETIKRQIEETDDIEVKKKLEVELEGIENTKEGIAEQLEQIYDPAYYQGKVDSAYKKVVEAFQEGFRKAVLAAIEAQTAAGGITYDQEIAIKLAFGEITWEQAQLLLFYEQIKTIVSSVFGVIEIDGVQINIGSYVLNSDEDTIKAIYDQIQALIDSGDRGKAAKIEQAIEAVAKLQYNGIIEEEDVADKILKSAEGIMAGQSVELAVGTAVNPEFAIDVEKAKEALQAKIDEALAQGKAETAYQLQLKLDAVETDTFNALTSKVNVVSETQDKLNNTPISVSGTTDVDEAVTAPIGVATEAAIKLDEQKPNVDTSTDAQTTTDALNLATTAAQTLDAQAPVVTVSFEPIDAGLSLIQALRLELETITKAPYEVQVNVTRTGDADGRATGGVVDGGKLYITNEGYTGQRELFIGKSGAMSIIPKDDTLFVPSESGVIIPYIPKTDEAMINAIRVYGSSAMRTMSDFVGKGKYRDYTIGDMAQNTMGGFSNRTLTNAITQNTINYHYTTNAPVEITQNNTFGDTNQSTKKISRQLKHDLARFSR